MFKTIEEVFIFFNENKNDVNVYKTIYEKFHVNAVKHEKILDSFLSLNGFGHLAFSWNWKLLVDNVPNNFKFLEIGVYKGRILSIIGLLANEINKECNIYGITPLSTSGDKYSVYKESNFLQDIQNNYLKYNEKIDNLHIIHGFSQDEQIINIAKENGEYDIIYIDGCHDYDVVVSDIQNYSKMIKINGYLIIDDSSIYIPNAFCPNAFCPDGYLGHYDVSIAADKYMNTNEDFIYLYSVGHNRVWKRCK